jgi:hypothetical protein
MSTVDSTAQQTELLLERSPSERRRAIGIVLLSVVVWAGMAAPTWHGGVLSGNDLGAFHYPLRAFYARCLEVRHAWDWCPHLFSGFYLTGEGQAGTYHPLHVLLYSLLPLGAAFNLEVLLNYPIMFAGMVAWLSRHLARRDSTLLAAALFTFSSFSLLHLVHVNAMAIVAQIPWLLWAYDLSAEARNNRQQLFRGLLFIVLLTASQILLGYPQYVWFSLLAELWYLTTILRPQLNAKLLLSLAGAKLVGVLLAAVQLLPTFEAVANSTRHHVSPEFLQSGSWHPLNLVQLVAPYLFTTRALGQNTHELGLYLGAVPILLLVMLLVEWRPIASSRFLTVSLTLAAFALLLAFGGYGALYPWQAYLPVVGKFRFPCRTLVLFQLAAAILTAAAWGRLCDHSSTNRSRSGFIAIWSIVLLSALVALLAPLVASTTDLAPWSLRLLGPTLFILAASLITLAGRGARWAPAALLLFTMVDLAAYGLSYQPVHQTAHWPNISNSVRETLDPWAISLSSQPDGPVAPWANIGCVLGLRQIDGYAGLEPAKSLDYRTAPAQSVAAVRFVYPCAERTQPTWPEVGPRLQAWQFESVAAPFARLVTKTQVSSDPRHDLSSIDWTSTVLVPEPLDAESGAPGQVSILRTRPSRMEFKTTASGRQLLVLAESFHAGWKATCDGELIATTRVNGDFLGAMVPAGTHYIEFRFRPHSLHWGAAITGMTALALALSLLGSLVSTKPEIEL